MKNIITTLIVLLGSAVGYAQWYQVPTGTLENLIDITFVDSKIGYCVSGVDPLYGKKLDDRGVILKTIDGGETWETVFSSDTLFFKSVHVLKVNNETKIYAYTCEHCPYIPRSSYLVSASVSKFRGWSVTPISYRPFLPKVHNNVLYFINFGNDYTRLLKKMENNVITTLFEGRFAVTYDVNNDGIFMVGYATHNYNRDSLFHSPDYGKSFKFISNKLPHHLSADGPRMVITENIVYMYGRRYPFWNGISIDKGKTFEGFEYGVANHPGFISKDEIYDVKPQYNSKLKKYDPSIIEKTDYKNSYRANTGEIRFRAHKFHFLNRHVGFVIGENGNIMKTVNGGGTTGGITSINEQLKEQIQVFPIPARDIIQLEIPSEISIASLQLYDTQGRLVRSFKSSARELPVSDLTTGNYLLKIATDKGQIHTEKVIVE